MMEMYASIQTAAKIVTTIGVIGGSAIALDIRHAPREQVDRMQAADRVQTVLSLVEQASSHGRADWICVTIEAEFAALCLEMPKHVWCDGPLAVETKAALMAKAGCR